MDNVTILGVGFKFSVFSDKVRVVSKIQNAKHKERMALTYVRA